MRPAGWRNQGICRVKSDGETRVEVDLKQVTLSQTTDYLHSIETSERLFAVKNMRIRTRSDGSDLLDVTFTVSSFEPI